MKAKIHIFYNSLRSKNSGLKFSNVESGG